MSLISEEQWGSLFDAPMRQLGGQDEAPFDFWPYVAAIPLEDFEGYDCSRGRVQYAYRHPAGRLEHVLINSDNNDVFMVVVLDRRLTQWLVTVSSIYLGYTDSVQMNN
jgi:hypothetical protein